MSQTRVKQSTSAFATCPVPSISRLNRPSVCVTSARGGLPFLRHDSLKSHWRSNWRLRFSIRCRMYPPSPLCARLKRIWRAVLALWRSRVYNIYRERPAAPFFRRLGRWVSVLFVRITGHGVLVGILRGMGLAMAKLVMHIARVYSHQPAPPSGRWHYPGRPVIYILPRALYILPPTAVGQRF